MSLYDEAAYTNCSLSGMDPSSSKPTCGLCSCTNRPLICQNCTNKELTQFQQSLSWKSLLEQRNQLERKLQGLLEARVSLSGSEFGIKIRLIFSGNYTNNSSCGCTLAQPERSWKQSELELQGVFDQVPISLFFVTLLRPSSETQSRANGIVKSLTIESLERLDSSV